LRRGLGRLQGALCINRLDRRQQGGHQPRRYLAMSVESLGRKVSGTFGVSAVAMRNQRNDIAVATRALRNRPRKAGYLDGLWGRVWRAVVSRLISREVQNDRNIEGSGQIGHNRGPAGQLDACLQRARSITVPQLAQVRRSVLA
jgi:hypothetical protein